LNELYQLSITEKVRYLEHLLYDFTITGRAIDADTNSTDREKLEAFKWLNELNHRIWNIRNNLQRNEDDNTITRQYNNMKFYGEQSLLLRSCLVPSVLGAYDRFKRSQ
jgi:hypothetical protein